MRRQDFNYTLPNELIARQPCAQRRDSRMLFLPAQAALQHAQFNQLSSLLKAGDFLVFNNSKVIPARTYGQKLTGGRIELLLERVLPRQQALVKIKSSKTPRAGTDLLLNGAQRVQVVGRQDDLFIVQFAVDPLSYFDTHGEIPLPPYIDRTPNASDRQRYQTVYATDTGSVAAPTAGLHFDEAMFAELRKKNIDWGFVTLHVGSGTYQPVRCDHIRDHLMHSEYIDVSAKLVGQIAAAKQRGGRIVAVGTTSLRSLESAATEGELRAFRGDTDIFIYPGFQFKTVDALLTNFHLPESTLLMLVSAFAGRERVLAAYQQAIAQRYRFFSYGDCMLIEQHTVESGPLDAEKLS